MTCPVETSVAAYALGTLDPAERAEVAGHLPTCRTCREQLDRVAGLPGLLSRVRAADVAAGPPVPGEQLRERVLAAAVAERAAQRRRRRLRTLTAAAAAVLVLGGGGAAAGLALSPGARSPGAGDTSGQVVAATQGPVRAQVWLHPADSGTGLTLRLSGVAPGEHCQLVAVGVGGEREVASSWAASYDGEARIEGSTAIPAARLARLVVETRDGRQLVTLPVQA